MLPPAVCNMAVSNLDSLADPALAGFALIMGGK
jgi:hypothetical protein